MIFFVFLAVLVMGFWANVSFAAKTGLEAPPAPGTPYEQLSPAWQNALYSQFGSVTNPLSYYHEVQKNGMPTTPTAYGALLKQIGGYTATEADKAGQQYINNFQNTNTYTGLDKELYDTWKQGKGWNRPLTNYVTAPVAQTVQGAGDKIGNFFASLVWDVVIGVLTILAYFCKLLLMYAGQALDMTLNPSLYNFTSNQMVVGGWIIVRDVCNLFFLLVLLFIAMCTILKIEKYHAKKTLLTLIIMALLINFSKPIAIFIFDGSQLLMNMFLSEITKNGSSPAATLAGDISKFLYSDLMANLNVQKGSMEIAVYYLFVVVFLFMFAVALFVMFLFMIIRIIVIMMLVIVSPLAFFAAIVPDFSKMSSQWWSALFEYSYYGPAAAFFLFLATKFAIGNSSSNILPQINIQGDNSIVIQHIVRYAVVLVFLYASIFMAKKFGGGAGAAIVGNANKVMKWAGGMSKGGGAWGSMARGTAQVTGATNMYKGVKGGIAKQPVLRMLTKEGREARSKERQEKWQERVAPFSIATAKKKAKERENDSEQDILRDAAKGDAAAMLVASQRGYSKDNNGNDLWTNANIIKSLQNNDIRKAAYGNLRDKGKTHHVLDAEIERQGIATNAASIRKLYDDELGGLSANNLGKQDLEAIAGNLLATNPATGDQWVIDKIKQLHTADPRLVTNMLSSGNSKNIQFIRDQRAMGNIP